MSLSPWPSASPSTHQLLHPSSRSPTSFSSMEEAFASLSLSGCEFLKILLPEMTNKKLLLPDGLARELGQLRDAKLQLAGGGTPQWDVKVAVGGDGGEVYLGRGWPQFARAHDLQPGHVLVFRFDAASAVFAVTVFHHSMRRRLYDHLSASPDSGSGTAAVVATGINEPSQFAKTLQPGNLRDKQNQYLNVPLEFVAAHGYTARKKVVLEMGGGSWTVSLKHSQGNDGKRTWFKYGWHPFCEDNGLAAGDTCFFRALREGDGGEHVLKVEARKRDGAFLE